MTKQTDDDWAPKPRPWRVAEPGEVEAQRKERAIVDANGIVVTSLRIEEKETGVTRIMQFFSKREEELVVACVNALAKYPYELIEKGYVDVRVSAEIPPVESAGEQSPSLFNCVLLRGDMVLIYQGELGEQMRSVCSTNIRHANRIAACLNACRGVSTELLASLGPGQLEMFLGRMGG